MRTGHVTLESIGAGYAEPHEHLRPAPTIIVPAQFFDGTPARHVPAGIRRLMVAILEDAMYVVNKHRHAVTRDKRRLYFRARRWFESEDRTWVFSFLRITEALGIEPELVKRSLRASRRATELAAS
jgi:hypothetical protein